MAADPHRYFSSAHIGFTLTADRPVELVRGRLRGLQGQAPAPPEMPFFAIEAPPGDVYVRSLSTYLGQQFVRRSLRTVQEIWFLHCRSTFRVTTQPSDQYAYVGAFTCHHEGELPTALTVSDRYGEAAHAFAQVLGGAPMQRRLAVPVRGPHRGQARGEVIGRRERQ